MANVNIKIKYISLYIWHIKNFSDLVILYTVRIIINYDIYI